MTAYYNEIDRNAAATLRNLIEAGLIAPGVVDTRSIEDVTQNDLKGFTQVHFFAGIGVWSYALRRAGWPDTRRVWTGSCPCQPFSAAGKGEGFADERHLWPSLYHLIRICRPGVVFGEQVASTDGLAWLDHVQADLENARYATAATDLCAAGFGAPHIRQRLFWLADTNSERREGERLLDLPGERYFEVGRGCENGRVADTGGARSQGRLFGWPYTQREVVNGRPGCDRTTDGLADPHYAEYLATVARSASEAPGATPGDRADVTIAGEPLGASNDVLRLADADGQQYEDRYQRPGEDTRAHRGGQTAEFTGLRGAGRVDDGGEPAGQADGDRGDRPRATNGFWGDADWLFCRDGKWRPVKPGLEPLANGVAGRVAELRAYGNAIVAPVAEGFIRAYMEAKGIPNI